MGALFGVVLMHKHDISDKVFQLLIVVFFRVRMLALIVLGVLLKECAAALMKRPRIIIVLFGRPTLHQCGRRTFLKKSWVILKTAIRHLSQQHNPLVVLWIGLLRRIISEQNSEKDLRSFA